MDENIRQRLVIENDDRQYAISDVLSIGESEGIPVVFDNLHHQVNPDNTRSDIEWITACASTWKQWDDPQKLHYSQQNDGKRPGSHSATLDADRFFQFYKQLPKDKNRYPVIEFYRLIDEAMVNPVKPGNAINAAQHVWGYFKDSSDKNTRLRFERTIDKVSKGGSTIPMKRLLWKLAEDEQQQYLQKLRQKAHTKLARL